MAKFIVVREHNKVANIKLAFNVEDINYIENSADLVVTLIHLKNGEIYRVDTPFNVIMEQINK